MIIISFSICTCVCIFFLFLFFFLFQAPFSSPSCCGLIYDDDRPEAVQLRNSSFFFWCCVCEPSLMMRLSLSVLHLISFSLSPFFQVPFLKIDFEEIKIWEKMGNHFFRCFFLCFVCRVRPSEQIRRAIKNHLLRPVVHCAEHVETRTVVVFFSLDIGDGHVYKKYIWLAPCRTERRNIKPRAS